MDHGNVHVVEEDEEFEVLISSASDSLVVVDFFAEWCGPCKMIAPLFASLSKEYTDVIFLKVTASKYGVRAMPTFMFFKGGNKVYEFKGANASLLQTAVKTYATGGTLSGGEQNQTPQPTIPALPLSPPEEKSPYRFFPQEAYIYADTGKIDQIAEKLLSFNTKFSESESTKQHSLDEKELSLFKKLCTTLKTTNMYHSSQISSEEHDVMDKLIRWPVAERFPCLDILRLMVLHPEAAKAHSTRGTLNLILEYLNADAPFANHLMELRYIANSFRFEATRNLVISSFQQVLQSLLNPLKTYKENKNIRVAVATVLLHYAIFFASSKDHKEDKKTCLTPLLGMVAGDPDEEVQFRCIIAIGTLAYKDEEIKKAILSQNAVIVNMKPAATKVNDARTELVMLLSNIVPPKQQPTQQQQPPQQVPSMNPFGNFGNFGGFPQMPNMPGMPQMTPELLQRVASSPAMQQAMSNPNLMAKLQQIMMDPSRAAELSGDPEVMQLVQQLSGLFQ